MSQEENKFLAILFRLFFAVTKSPLADCLIVGSFLLYFSENKIILDLLKTDIATMQNWGMIFIVIVGIILILLIPPRIRPTIMRNLVWRPFHH